MNDPRLSLLKRSPACSRRKRVVKGSKRILEILLLILTLLSFLTGTSSNGVQNPHKEKLNGILGGSVLLSVNIPPEEKLKTILWAFEGGDGLKLQLVELREGKPQRANPMDRFGQRLELANETILRIKDLEMDDSGKYSIRVNFISRLYEDHTFHLSVYEPVPEPKILYRHVSNSPDGCNVTLQCHVPGNGEFNISWKRGDAFMDLEDGSKSYHLSGNGKDLHLFWKVNSSEPNITCLVSNPADQKRISLNLLHICPTEGGHQFTVHLRCIFFIIFFVILLLFLAAFELKTRKRRRKIPPNEGRKLFVRAEGKS